MGRYFAAIGQGRSLVQGQIAINFISEGYLYAVLDNYQGSSTSSNPQQDELNQLVAAQSNPGQTVLGVTTPTDPAVQARIQALTASLGPSTRHRQELCEAGPAGHDRHHRQLPQRRLPGRPLRYRA
jgi:hypothetical protein